MRHINIVINLQKLFLYDNKQLLKSYSISSAKNGVGYLLNSYTTPLGVHEICEKIGANCPIDTVFKGRKPIGLYNQLTNPSPDSIMARILRLNGLEDSNSNTLERLIYIHGTHDNNPMNIPLSIGCIRMRNLDILELFDEVDVGTRVNIVLE